MISLLLSLVIGAAAQSKVPVDLMLVLAVDVSASVDGDEYLLQKRGLARALRDPEVGRVLELCNNLGVAMTYVEWSGLGLGERRPVQQVVGWQLLRTQKDLWSYAARLDQVESRSSKGSTDIAAALRFSIDAIRRSTMESSRQVISLSSDGQQNVELKHMTPEDNLKSARQAVQEAGAEIDALVILEDFVASLQDYFRDYVISANGRVESIETYKDYAESIRTILLRTLNTCAM